MHYLAYYMPTTLRVFAFCLSLVSSKTSRYSGLLLPRYCKQNRITLDANVINYVAKDKGGAARKTYLYSART